MKRGIDHGIMLTDLDASHRFIRKLGGFSPKPPNLVDTDDPRLSDSRPILDGSVTDASVALDAGIVQSKLDLNGDIPLNFLGTTGAAQGNLVQPLSQKDVPNGYVSLGVNGKLPSGSTSISGTGTLHAITFDLPVAELTTVEDTDTATQVFTGYWSAQNAETWFGNQTGASAQPTFGNHLFPVSLIPNFDASKITSEQFAVDQVPVAVGVGVDHAPGLLPPPTSTDIESSAHSTDYLARDMTYRPMPVPISYQPKLPPPSITVQSYFQGQAYVSISSSVGGANLFHATGTDPFVEIIRVGDQPSTPILASVATVVTAYAAKAGFSNSDISTYTIPPGPFQSSPPTT